MQEDLKRKYRQEQAQIEAWHRGILSWKYHASQLKVEAAYNSISNQFFLLNCSRRFGKTFWLVCKAIECLLTCKNPLPRIKYAAATYEELIEFIIPSIEIVLADCPEEIRPIYMKSAKKLINPANGGELKLIGIDRNPNGGRGNYCDLYIVDEARNMTSDTLKYLYSSVIYPMCLTRDGSKIIFASTPPDSADHSFASVFIDKAKEENAYVEFNIFEAAHLTKKQIEAAKKECLTDEDWQREYLCQIITNPDRALIPPKIASKLVIKELPRPSYYEHLHKYVAMDIGVKNDFTAVGFGYWDPREKHFFLEQEYTVNGPEMTTSDLACSIRLREKRQWGSHKAAHLRVADSNEPLLIQDLSIDHDLHFIRTSKESLHAMVNTLREFILKGHLVIHPQCEKTIGALKYGLWNKNRDKFGHSKAYGHYDHVAMLMYLVRNLNTWDDPIPWHFDKTVRGDVLLPHKIRHLKNKTTESILVDRLTMHNKRK